MRDLTENEKMCCICIRIRIKRKNTVINETDNLEIHF